jgi:hypothetical protein
LVSLLIQLKLLPSGTQPLWLHPLVLGTQARDAILTHAMGLPAEHLPSFPAHCETHDMTFPTHLPLPLLKKANLAPLFCDGKLGGKGQGKKESKVLRGEQVGCHHV